MPKSHCNGLEKITQWITEQEARDRSKEQSGHGGERRYRVAGVDAEGALTDRPVSRMPSATSSPSAAPITAPHRATQTATTRGREQQATYGLAPESVLQPLAAVVVAGGMPSTSGMPVTGARARYALVAVAAADASSAGEIVGGSVNCRRWSRCSFSAVTVFGDAH